MKNSLSVLLLLAILCLWSQPGFTQEKKSAVQSSLSDMAKPDNTVRVIGHTANSPLAYLNADFEDPTFPPTRWTIIYTGTVYWTRVTTCSGYGVGAAAAKFNFYSASSGTTQSLETSAFAPAVAGDSLKFDHAYATYTNNQNDQLKLETSTDGTTFTQLVLLDGGNSGPLATAPGQSGAFTPTAAQWATKTFALPVGTIKVRFTAISAYGNNLYVDNIRLGTAPANDVGVVSIDMPGTLPPGNVTPKATVKNFGSAAQPSFNVTFKTTNYTSTKAVTNLAPNATVQVTFDNWFAPEGSFVAKAFTQLTGDANPMNDTVTVNLNVTSVGWVSLAPSPNALSRSCAAKLGNFIYQFGGGSGTTLKSVAKYDIGANTWSALSTTIPTGISSGTAIAINNDEIIVLGGESTAGLGKAYKYNATSNAWTTLAAMPTGVTDALCVRNGNYIYVVGGGDGLFGTVVKNTVQVYNITTDTWATGSALPVALTMMGGGLINNKIIFSGGWNGTAAVATTYIGTIGADPATITWVDANAPYPGTTTTRMASYVKGIGTNPGIIFSGGAIAGSTVTGNTYNWNFTNSAWETLPPLPVARSNMKGAGDGTTEFYVVAGYNGTAGVGNLDKLMLGSNPNPSLVLTSPNGGELWDIGTQYPIKWTANLVQNIKIEYTTDNGTAWTTIVASTPAEKFVVNDPLKGTRKTTEGGQLLGQYMWTVPNTPSTQCKVKVTDVTTATMTDMSDAVFTIRTPIPTNEKLVENFNGSNTPDGLAARGWKWVNNDGGGTTAIYNGSTTVFTAYEGPDTGYAAQNYNGANVMYIDQWLISPQVNIASGDSLTFWMRGASTQYPDSIEVRWSPTGDTALASFTGLWGKYLVTPLAWAQWKGTFNAAGNMRVAIRYLIYSGGATGQYSDYIGIDLLKIIGQGVVTPSITVTAPNGGENWTVATQHNITWNSTSVTGFKIDYSTNNGTTWLAVANNLTASPYAWTVPNTPSTNCKVRVSDLTNTVSDVSDAVFTISTGGPVITWQTVINLKDNSTTNQNLTFGQAPTATNGIDTQLGEQSLPPAPPAGVFDARFILPTTPPDASLKDYRNTTLQQVDWVMNFQPSAAGYPFTFTWTPANLPSGSFFLKDAITGTIVNVDMKTTGTYTLTNTGITSLKIVFTSAVTKDINLAAGWNIISIPLMATSMLTSQIFPAATSPAYGYNNGYVVKDTLAVDKGYWIRYANAAVVTVTGSAIPANTVPLAAGWNLVGVHMTDVPVANITTTPTGIINSPFYGFAAGYVQPTALVSGKGYWVRTSAAGVMNLGTLAKDGNIFSANVEKDWARILVSDAAGNSSTLYAGVNVQNISNFELPPVPPAGIFDVRYASNRNVELLGDAKEINISSAQYPVTIQTNGIELRVRDRATNGKLVNEVIPANGTLRITNPAVSVIEVQTTETPLSYELMQNYPNPFNPTTSIKFGLPEKANVSLAIYNQLGEKIATLVNGELGAGYHKVEWNASNMTSGIYFYEIRTDKFSEVKKLILMK
jgi:hypothetical protein